MFRIIFLFIACYLGYKVIFEFILPAYRASKTVQSRFREMQGQMQGDDAVKGQTRQSKETLKPEGDYIEFEEVK